ncbi:hypothetical protein ABMA28_000900 [Loxostege sticticalis]|uniref:Putative ionotropic receptor ligand binding domain-containing protein n=1 Tax=Loxostege sticticalis TaxID=481309 RepID=A0ABD0T6M4_LOXSC
MFIATKFGSNLFLHVESRNKIAESAAQIAIHNFQWSYITLVLFNSTTINGVDLFLRLYKKGQIIGRDIFYPSFAQKTRQFILFGTDLVNIEQMLDWMQKHQFDNTGRFIVTCQSERPEDCDETKAVDIFWNHKIINVVFMKQTPDEEVNGYTYYHPDENCRSSQPVKIKTLRCTKYNNTTPCLGIFPKKMKNLHWCPIIVSTFKQMPYMSITDEGVPYGADGDLLLLIAEGLNATLKVMTPRRGFGWGNLNADGVWVGSLADVFDDVANFSMTSAAVTLSRFTYFQMSTAYYTSNVVWITRPAEKKPASLKLFYPFQTLSQIALAFSFIFVGLCVWLVNSKYWPWHNSTEEASKLSSVIFYSWMICMGLPSTKLPAKKEFICLVLIWIWYCFLIRTFYQVYLINSLQGEFYSDEIDTIEDAYFANYSFGGGPALRDYFIDHPLVYDNWKNLNASDIIPTLINLTEKKFVLATNQATTESIIKEHNLIVHILPQKVINSPSVIFSKKFSPLVEPLNIILRRLLESGFTDKLYKNYATQNTWKSDNPEEPITLEHYTGCYVILVVGWVVSTLIFIIELFYTKLQKCKYYIIKMKPRLGCQII